MDQGAFGCPLLIGMGDHSACYKKLHFVTGTFGWHLGIHWMDFGVTVMVLSCWFYGWLDSFQSKVVLWIF